MKNLLNPYSILIDFKNYFYDKRFFKQIEFDTKIISIGNLNTGGSGKTPIIRYIAEILNHHKILIICKSYKASLKNPSRVDLNRPDAVKIFGDEACLLQQLLPNCDVWSGPSKSETAQAAFLNNKYDIVLIDDGFSHRKLFRHRDIVLVDASRSRQHYQLFPYGQMREDWKTLRRSHLVILTKTENLSPEKLLTLQNKIKKHTNFIITAEFKTVFLIKPETKKIQLVTGVGNPEKLKTDLESQGFEITDHKKYTDHYDFPEAEQEQLLKSIEQFEFKKIQTVMTGKDFIKITNVELKNKISVIEIEVSISDSDRKILYDQILS